MQLNLFERRSSYIFFAILNQTHELFLRHPVYFDCFALHPLLAFQYPLSIYIQEIVKNMQLHARRLHIVITLCNYNKRKHKHD